MLVELHAPRVKWLLHREFCAFLGAEGIDDAMAEGVHRAWRAASTYDSARGSLRAWFYVICRNCARKLVLREKRGPRLVPFRNLEGMPAPDAEAEVETGPASPWLVALRACIEALPRLMRAVVRADLRAPGGVAPADDVVAETGASTGSVYNARSRARARLRVCLRNKGHDFAAEGRNTRDRSDGTEVAERTEER